VIAPNLSEYDGPRTPTPDEWEATVALARRVFFPNVTDFASAARAWPMVFHGDRRENTIAMFRDGAPVSMVQGLERDFVTGGVVLRVGYVGSVCTDASHRGNGLASAALEATHNRFREHGADFAYISGTRPLYYAAGANHVGIELRFRVDDSSPLGDLPKVSVRQATPADAALIARLHSRETTRIVRRPADFALVLDCGYCAGRQCGIYVVELGGTPVGYYATWAHAERSTWIIEYGGGRTCVLAAIRDLAQSGGMPVDVSVPRRDGLGELLDACGIAGVVARTGGTVKALDPARTLRKLLNPLAERGALPNGFEVTHGSGRWTAVSGDDTLRIDGEGAVLRVLLGAPSDDDAPSMDARGVWAGIADECLPISMPSVVLNMI